MDINNIKFSVIGGDERFAYLAESLGKNGYEVSSFGFDTFKSPLGYTVKCPSLEDAKSGADCLILPLPYTKDGVNINAPFSKRKSCISEVFENIPSDTVIFAGKCDEKISTLSRKRNCFLVDYMDCEDIAILNTVPTAEGAVEIAMKETVFTLHGADVAVCGFGRVGGVLAHKLRSLGANVTVCARRDEILSLARAYGYKAIKISNIDHEIYKFDIIFNTVPSVIFTSSLIDKMNKKTLIIDLASLPGGVDFTYAEAVGLKAISALSLPGKCAPKTAGEILKDGILNILRKR